jgi:hypothetical protein
MINRTLQNWPDEVIVVDMEDITIQFASGKTVPWPDLSRDARAMEQAMRELGTPATTDELKSVLKRAQEIKDTL